MYHLFVLYKIFLVKYNKTYPPKMKNICKRINKNSERRGELIQKRIQKQ